MGLARLLARAGVVTRQPVSPPGTPTRPETVASQVPLDSHHRHAKDLCQLTLSRTGLDPRGQIQRVDRLRGVPLASSHLETEPLGRLADRGGIDTEPVRDRRQ